MSRDLTFLFHRLEQGKPGYPARLLQRLGDQAPPVLVALGNMDVLALPRTALFCSAKAPGSAILAVHDEAARLRDEGRCVISGFHSPIEKQCLRILLRGKQPIIICLGRAIEPMRLPAECRTAFGANRLLFLSPFAQVPKRVTRESGLRRNEVVAALADDALVAFAGRSSSTESLVGKLRAWQVPVTVSP